MATMLLEKGQAHENAVLASYVAEGRSIHRVPERRSDGSGGWEWFDEWVARVGNPMAEGHDVIFQMPFVHDGMRGVADFLVHAGTDDQGRHVYEVVDAKLARVAAKPGHVLQLCFYADALRALTGVCGEHVHIALGSGRTESIRLAEVDAYWRRLRSSLSVALDEAPTAATVAEPCSHCQFCSFEGVCDAEWREQDSLVYVANLRSADRHELVDASIATMADLADHVLDQVHDLADRAHDDDLTHHVLADHDLTDRETERDHHPAPSSIDVVHLDRHVRQAGLQVGTQALPPESAPLFELIEQEDGAGPESAAASMASTTHASIDPNSDAPLDLNDLIALPKGFAALPAPDAGDVFLDFEGHPFWTPEAGLFFLFGLIQRRDPIAGDGSQADEWEFVDYWAHDLDEERTATEQLISHLADRLERFPAMHVYHYNHTEKSSLERLTVEHGVAELALEKLVTTGFFIDLYPIVKDSVAIGTESYGLKHVERLTDYERSHEIDRGSGAVVEYERWTVSADDVERSDILSRIARYNEDDVRATRAVRDWLTDHRPDGVEWRDAVLDPFERNVDLDARIEQLHVFGPGTPEHLMGDLLGYWKREDAANYAQAAISVRRAEADLRESPSVIGGLIPIGPFERLTDAGNPMKSDGMAFRFPSQKISTDFDDKRTQAIWSTDELSTCRASIDLLDRENGVLQLIWSEYCVEKGVLPTAIAPFTRVKIEKKEESLAGLADQMLAGETDIAGLRYLRGEAPRFVSGGGPQGGVFDGDLDRILAWVTQIDRSVVPIQGPPGTGKTYVGSHIAHALVQAGKRVGITAYTHKAVDNLLQATIDVFDSETAAGRTQIPLDAVRKDGAKYERDDVERAGITKGRKARCNVFAGSTWLFGGNDLDDAPVDVLLVDEAGQIGLADVLASSTSATSVILLGDPQQLSQVVKAAHPNDAGRSALGHVLDGKSVMPPERGVFLDRTYRMHPDVNEFISDVMYEGDLESDSSCDGQTTAAGTGLRWLRAEHSDRSTEAPEEADLIAATIKGLIGTPWTNQRGETAPLGPADFMVVAPFNDQRRLVRDVLRADPVTADVPVGTVDLFQGQEAAVVLFSMTSSSADDTPRGIDFLFSLNRLNVAISRARCLAYLCCTDQLLDAVAASVDDMRRVSALCSFVERAEVG